MLSKQQMLNHDYDWFCVINEKPVCIASNGGFIPDIINKNNNIINTQRRAYNLPRLYKFKLNVDYIINNVVNTGFDYVEKIDSPYRELLRPKDIVYPPNTPLAVTYYAEHFAKMAERGFYVFDRLQESENSYFLVSWPSNYNMELLRARIYRDDEDLSFNIPQIDFENCKSLVDIDIVDLIANL